MKCKFKKISNKKLTYILTAIKKIDPFSRGLLLAWIINQQILCFPAPGKITASKLKVLYLKDCMKITEQGRELPTLMGETAFKNVSEDTQGFQQSGEKTAPQRLRQTDGEIGL